jgi:ABC-2 type transport system ATP-binding protein
MQASRRDRVEYHAAMTSDVRSPPTSNAPAISVRDLGYRYADAPSVALQGIEFDVLPAEIFGLLGPNGAGKSTLLGIMSGSLECQSGEVTIAGERLTKRARNIKRLSAVVPQEYAFYESLSGRQNLAYFGSVFGLSRSQLEERRAKAVEICQLETYLDRTAGKYSGGLKRRLNLAIGLLNAPQILYLDEPTVGIDAESRRYILDAVLALKALGTTIVYTSHYMEEVEELCDAVAIIDQGRLVLHERMQNLLRREGGDALQLTLREPNAGVAAVLAAFSPTHVDHKHWTLNIAAQRLPEVLTELERSGIAFDRLQYGVSRLEKIYLEVLLRGSNKVEAAA